MDDAETSSGTSPEERAPSRRDLLGHLSSAAMALGLAAGYGTVAWMAGRYLYPAKPRATRWLYVSPVRRFPVGQSIALRTPVGERVTIARQGAAGGADDFVALSSTCPHLGCQVHWQVGQERFFCPCHNGVFDPSGNPVSGPPAEAGTPLPRFPLEVQAGILYIQAPTERLAAAGEGSARRAFLAAGHDPCLGPPGGGEPA